MPGGPEHTIVEMPIIHSLTHLGYHYLRPEQNDLARDGQNNVILRDVFLQAIQKINSITKDVANSVYQELLSIRDNEKWTSVLQGNYSKSVPGEAKKKTIYPIDFREPGNNTFTVTNQFYVESEKSRIPDVVCFINGIPVVVIEAKSPVSIRDKMGEAFEQIKHIMSPGQRFFTAGEWNFCM